MPEPDLSIGFFGKLPATGDFVTRGLPASFVAPWDRWVARHLLPRLAPGAPPLFFHRPGKPAFTGVVLPSRDCAGRRFPLSLAAPCPDPPPVSGLKPRSQRLRPLGGKSVEPASVAWVSTAAAIGEAAIREALPTDILASRLAGISGPPGVLPPLFLLWTDPAAARIADPDHPGPVLDALLAAPAETG